jgi:hypothetical protein
MKKLITLVMLSIFAMTNVNAEEQTLWEGSTDINWGNSNVLIPTTEMAEVPVGATIRLSYELVDMPENYHAMRITTNWWGENPEDDLVAQFSLSSETPSTYEFIYSEARKALVDQREGMLIVGYGYKLTKVEAVTGSGGETIVDLESALLWQGEQEINGWGGKVLVLTEESEGFNVFVEKLTTACNLYFLMEDATGGDFRIAGQWGDWGDTTYPSAGYNHMAALDEDNVVKVSLTQDFVSNAFVNKGGVAFWGDGGFKIKAIATTKETLLCPVTTDALGYATYGSSYTLALDLLPEGLKAFTANQEGATLSFAKKTEAVGPGTGLLIQGEANTTYYLPAKTDDTAPAYNALSANLSANKLADLWKENDENYVFLMKKNTTGTGNIEFKKLTNTDLVVPANKAYVQVSPSVFTTSAHELSISFGEGEVTGISEATLLNINEVIKNNNVYDLSGRRVAKPTKGLYIVNGKKVVIK